MICKNCGSDIKEDSKFCGNCGAPTNVPAAESPQYNNGTDANGYSPYGSDYNQAPLYSPENSSYPPILNDSSAVKKKNTRIFAVCIGLICFVIAGATAFAVTTLKYGTTDDEYPEELPDISGFTAYSDYTYVSSEEALALYSDACDAYSACNYGNAVTLLEEAVLLECPEAMNLLGDCYYYGEGVAADDERAFELYLQSAQYNYVKAQYDVAHCYEVGRGTEIDEGKALEYFNKAALQGDAFSQERLGSCYYYGTGTDIDYSQAIYWYTVCASSGNCYGRSSLGDCYYDGCGIKRNYEKAFEYYMLAAEEDVAYAQYSVAYCYYCGNGVECDYELARYWCTRAVNNGWTDAEELLDDIELYCTD